MPLEKSVFLFLIGLCLSQLQTKDDVNVTELEDNSVMKSETHFEDITSHFDNSMGKIEHFREDMVLFEILLRFCSLARLFIFNVFFYRF